MDESLTKAHTHGINIEEEIALLDEVTENENNLAPLYSDFSNQHIMQKPGPPETKTEIHQVVLQFPAGVHGLSEAMIGR